MTNSEQAPAEIFDWLEKLPFSSLNEQQQQTVLMHFTPGEYDDLHAAAKTIKGIKPFNLVGSGETDKTRLNSIFEKQHREARVIAPYTRHLFLWQAAAAVLFVLSGWLFYKLFDFKTEAISTQMAGVDTVYVDKTVQSPGEIIHDTVILYKYLMTKENKEKSREITNEVVNTAPQADIMSSDIMVMGIGELENAENKPRRNSMKDDSLIRKFGFISM